MRHGLKPTALASEASLFPRLALGAAMAVDALRVITFQPKPTGRHAGNGGQDMKFLPGQLAVVVMITVLLVGAFPKQEEIIAQLQLLQAIEFITRNALEIEAIHALPIFVPFHSLWRRHRTAGCLGANDLKVRGLRCFIRGRGS